MAKIKGEQPKQQYLPPGVKEIIGPDGNKIAAKYLGAGVGAFAVSNRLNSNNQENEPIN